MLGDSLRREGAEAGVGRMVQANMKVPYVLSAALAAFMFAQSALGRVFPGQYRDVEWIRATWFGDHWITLVVGAPLLVASILLTRRFDPRAATVARRARLRSVQLRVLHVGRVAQRLLPTLRRGTRAVRGHAHPCAVADRCRRGRRELPGEDTRADSRGLPRVRRGGAHLRLDGGVGGVRLRGPADASSRRPSGSSRH